MRRDPRDPILPIALVTAGAVALLLSGAPAAEAKDRESPPSRPSPVTRAPSASAPSSPPPSVSPSPRAPSGSGSSVSGGSRGYRRGGGHSYGLRIGFGHRYGYYPYHFYGYSHYWPYRYYGYHRPYYPWGLTWYPAYAGDERVGAIDLAVKPKKTAVYVDGQYVGNAGKFDGFPGYLWLAEGTHQLVFHREGYETVSRDVRVRFGPVIDLEVRLPEGNATDPEELFEPVERTARAEPAPERSAPSRAPEVRERGERRAELDLRGEPGRFRLDVAPLDASVYLDGRFLGSGEELARLHAGMMVDAGEHVLDVQRPGYETRRVEFSVEPGDETEIEVALDSLDAPGE